MLAGSFAGVTVKLKVELEGVEESSLPSSTLTWKEADVVSEPSCSKETKSCGELSACEGGSGAAVDEDSAVGQRGDGEGDPIGVIV